MTGDSARFRHTSVTHTCVFSCFDVGVSTDELRPTVKQVYALARELCERAGEEWPTTRAEVSQLIERLRAENEKGVTA